MLKTGSLKRSIKLNKIWKDKFKAKLKRQNNTGSKND